MASQQQGAHPLRPYYQPPEDQGVFVASAPSRSGATNTTGSRSSSSSTGRSAGPASGSSSTYPHRHGNQSAMVTIDSPRQKNRYASATDDVESEFGSLSDWTSAAIMSLALQYSSTCISMPFEVGKMLLQVQWVPKDEVWKSFADSYADMERQQLQQQQRSLQTKSRKSQSQDPFLDNDNGHGQEEEFISPEAQEWRRQSRRQDSDEDGEFSEEDEDGQASSSSHSDVEEYFRDATASSSRPQQASKRSRNKKATTDASGYLTSRSVRRGGDDASTRPEHITPVVVRGGVWEMIKAVARGKEGYYGLWKGTFTTFLYDLLATGIQPVVSAIISPLIPHSLSTLPLPYVPHPKRTLGLLVASHVITHYILSPLDLTRTRLIVQSTLPKHRKYTGPWNALKQILEEEGGWGAIYGHPHLVIPALLDLTIRPFISLVSPLMLERMFRVEVNTSPVSFAFAELMINTSTLLISLPIETVRRRMQVQRRASWGKTVMGVHGSRSSPFTTPTKKNNKKLSIPSSTQSNPITLKGLRTCVETRPEPYSGVWNAISSILTEETSQFPHFRHRPSHPHRRNRRLDDLSTTSSSSNTMETPERGTSNPLHHSEILAPQRPTYTTFGGVKSLYRGFTMAAGANLVVFLLTVVTGERSTTGSATKGGLASSRSGGMGGWAEI
ncbi:unnamed protein product [Sympodiomycopsis kandeliae]